MKEFVRDFPVEKLADWDSKHAGNAVRRLFDLWVLPGLPATKVAMLRIGIRSGYLNFYVKGQSVAKLSYRREGPTIEAHRKYVNGLCRVAGIDARVREMGTDYISISAVELAKATTADAVALWSGTAETYASAEKRFVDELVGQNAGVIDLEMGLPAGAPGDPAPRMELVLVQTSSGAAQIAFWEAKCANNPELRAKAEYHELDDDEHVGPSVIRQLRRYQKWVGQPDRAAEVEIAYRQTAGTLLKLAKVFGKNDAPCLSIWSDLAGTVAPIVILPPGVVIGNYCPQGHTMDDADAFRRLFRSFKRHRERLVDHGITIHEVGPDQMDFRLPHLIPGCVTAARKQSLQTEA